MVASPRRVLLTEASSTSARQCITILGRQGHTIEVLETRPSPFTEFSPLIAARHPTPPMGTDPGGYLDALRGTLGSGRFDVLLPTHEQLALVSGFAHELAGGAAFAVPGFAALRLVQDKTAAVGVLQQAGVAQPDTRIVWSAEVLRSAWQPGGWFVKVPIASGSTGVWRVDGERDLAAVADAPLVSDSFARGWPVLIQREVAGPVVMVVGVFAHGRMAGVHAARRTREGVNGGAAGRQGVVDDDACVALERLGGALAWHGPLGLDAVDTADGLRVIDVNPRLVEPYNAFCAGVDLVAAMLDVAEGRQVETLAPVVPRAKTHALVMALVASAARGRTAVVRELAAAALRVGPYAGSAEELLPRRWDSPSAHLNTKVAIALLRDPLAARAMGESGTGADGLSPDAWQWLLENGETDPRTEARLPHARREES